MEKSGLLLFIISSLIGGWLIGLLIRRGYVVRPKKISFPFFEFEVSKFASLTPVMLFDNLTMTVLSPVLIEHKASEVARVASDTTPIVLIHAGWNLVCDAFIRRFQAYPDNEKINAAAATIGGQNVEFVKMYRDTRRRDGVHKLKGFPTPFLEEMQ